MKKINLLLTLCLSSSLGFSQIIYTLAGTGTGGFSGDGGYAASAKIQVPQGIALDASGNLYIADESNYRVRKVSTKGIISTVAGNGTSGFSGDGGAATSAKLDSPEGVAVDGSGNIYIADVLNNRIRKVTAGTGIITTVAGSSSAGYSGDGGAATSATLTRPTDVAVDASGNLYIADLLNGVIRKVTASTGIISTIAGTGAAGYSGDGGPATSATLNGANGIKVDASGNVYIADQNNHCIRMITASTGNISTVAGNGTQGFAGDGGAATSAQLNNPRYVAVDASGNIYIPDFINYRVRKVTASTGNISTIAGTGTAGYSGDGGVPTSANINAASGIAVDGSGNVYFGDYQNKRIRVVTSTCPANAGPNVNDQQGICGTWGVKIGAPSVPNMTYVWSPNTSLSSTSIAQPTSTWQTVGTPQVYTVTVSNANCTSATSQVTVTAVADPCHGGCCRLTDPSTEGSGALLPANFSVYPNPSNGNVTIALQNNSEYVRIRDMQGRIVFQTNNINAGEFKVDISKFTKGIYMVTNKTGSTIENQKLIVE